MNPESSHRNAIEQYIPILFPYAYNILGAVEDAKDAVQEVLTKQLSDPNALVKDEKSYLIKSVINLAINMKTRQKKTTWKEEFWLPEPIATDDAADRNLHLNEVLSYSLLVLMERLNARERAVFILRESFDYSHAEIAEILSVTEDYSRKLLSRAKASIFKPAPKRTQVQAAHERQVLERFMSAIQQRDTQLLESIMAADIRFYADGGGKVPLVTNLCIGAPEVAALQILVYHKFLRFARIVFTVVNHQPAFLSFVKERLTSCVIFDLHPEHGTVLQINAVLDPDKLKTLKQTHYNA
ncbi:RNA polymerase subunit sigma-24 [Adhaeribacter arboris]|uniref:RNA polymerase subunit sigma-24 n=1 Tax=Adhaeribacter arboris TaxID=2072846 RepID=A0A2T2YLT6_9BACT|nr:sigma-70 family RNA polymerase sigma factor [Adhaeribacter arboris]PSR56470.1 RNA polymerase subunit sigma-24 [Adhaeribacter arboris]